MDIILMKCQECGRITAVLLDEINEDVLTCSYNSKHDSLIVIQSSQIDIKAEKKINSMRYRLEGQEEINRIMRDNKRAFL